MVQPPRRADLRELAHQLIATYFFNAAEQWIASSLVEIPLATSHITEHQFRWWLFRVHLLIPCKAIT
jgi:hypothetical protein